MKQPTYILKIDNPCKQDWDLMTTMECGKYCSYCTKKVVDFSSLTDTEVFNVINNTSGKICGRLTSEQLNRAIFLQQQSSKSPFLKLFAGLLFIGLSKNFIAFGQQARNNILKVQTSDTKNKTKEFENELIDTSLNEIQGKVIDSQTKENLPRAAVVIKGTKIGVATNNEGNFSLLIPDSLSDLNIVLTVSYVGYSVKEISVGKKGLQTHKNFFITQLEQAWMGEVIIIRKKKWWQFWK